MSELAVSIIVSTLNRADHLRNALTSLSHLDYPCFEIVVINGPSSDTTNELLEEWQPRIKIGLCLEANLSMSRNIGIALASGEIVAFIDDDAVVHPNGCGTWLICFMTGASAEPAVSPWTILASPFKCGRRYVIVMGQPIFPTIGLTSANSVCRVAHFTRACSVRTRPFARPRCTRSADLTKLLLIFWTRPTFVCA